MDNRFGFRDLIICALLVAVVIVMLLGMQQYDRQWDDLQQLKQSVSEMVSQQAKTNSELTTLREQLSSGQFSQGSSGAAAAGQLTSGTETQPVVQAGEEGDPFDRIRAAQQMPGYALGDHFVDVFSVIPDRLTPLVSSDAYAANIQGQVLESLATRDPVTLDWKPHIARSWSTSEDGLRIEFELRKGVRFSDGTPLTADDVVYSFDLIMNESINAPRVRAYYSKIEKVEKLDDYRVAFVFREPYFESFGLAASLEILPKHFYSRYSAEQFNQSIGLLLGSGPYRLEDPVSWTPGRPLVLVRNERYWGEPAPFDRLVYRIIDNDVARLIAFRNGETDAFYAQPEQYEELKKDEELLKRTLQFEYDTPTGGYRYIAWNQKRVGKPTLFADKRVRLAMTHLINREAIAQDIMLGYASVATGPFNRLGKQVDPSIEPWPFSTSKARDLLKQAGWEVRDRSGILKNAAGEPFRFRLIYPAGSDVYQRMVLFIKDDLARAGVQMEPEPTEWSVLVEKLDKRDFDAITLGWTGGIETDIYQMFHSSLIESGDNFMSYSNPELDKLMEQARRTVNEEERLPLWRECQRILHEDQPYTFLLTGKSLIFLDGRFKNVQKVNLGLNPREEWYVPRNQWKWAGRTAN